ncbi:hypothetical protein CHS0354_007365 [Potamilus streckersoni]|uniref:Carbonic anhydrase n=1 Tax=Potamilus streckersoni TaxID=2493646 RepID=A0AAE0TIZ4_9BIVA|nr:hypothetical protein CHS0354_007365 [Potamilus streckersoni]
MKVSCFKWVQLLFIVIQRFFDLGRCEIWEHWWGYDGISGPSRWGMNPEWTICKNGKHQSPIDIKPETLLFDHHLKYVQIDLTHVNGQLVSTGNDVTFWVSEENHHHINISSGPLSYLYRLSHIKLHYGYDKDNGSEHTVANRHFSGEIHFIAYNVELYKNYEEASISPKGLVILSVFLSVNDEVEMNRAFSTFENKLIEIEIGNWSTGAGGKRKMTDIHYFSIEDLLPKTEHYMTYSGSLTQPGCQETATWIIFNKPIHIPSMQLKNLLKRSHPEWMHANRRPIMPLNHRTVRTNINFKGRRKSRLCDMEVNMFYQVNALLKD